MVSAIGSSTSSLNSLFHINRNSNSLQKALQGLSSGLRINSAADDAAGLAIATSLSSEETSSRQASRNVADAGSVLNVAEGGLSTVSDLLQRGRELATQASNGFLNPTQRQAIQQEFTGIRNEIDRVSQATNFNGQPLLDGSLAPGATQTTVQAGTGNSPSDKLSLNVIPAQNSTSLGIAGVDLSTSQGAQAALSSFDTALNSVADARGSIGALQNRLDKTASNLEVSQENIAAARSRIQDLDYAKGVSDLQQANLLTNIGYNGLGQSLKSQQQYVGKLLNFSV